MSEQPGTYNQFHDQMEEVRRQQRQQNESLTPEPEQRLPNATEQRRRAADYAARTYGMSYNELTQNGARRRKKTRRNKRTKRNKRNKKSKRKY